ncbi:hypothetical protein [Arthrobacter cavernae]|uniref:Uncharacterized protein n=1 Tax=Arthrobacter cavernae TaxID=2817681 RepID=A0A939HJR8_9MICC|nr:hypothetical protein [Arthrobacter cavernae]MBO1269478.1 hypothetical protein [Arthrobacter cavernae]
MTQWAHITRTDWAQTIGQDAAAELFADFLGRGSDVQLVLPDRRTGEGDAEAARDLNQLVRFVKTNQPSKFLIHPEPSQMQEITDRGTYQDADRI